MSDVKGNASLHNKGKLFDQRKEWMKGTPGWEQPNIPDKPGILIKAPFEISELLLFSWPLSHKPGLPYI